jgi:kynurenine formamidase
MNATSPRFIEVSHRIEPGMKTYPGLPEPRAEVLLDYEASRPRYAGGTEFFIASLHLCGNTGTYVDSPRHRFRGASDLSELPLERLAHLPVELIDARGVAGRGAGRDVLRGRSLEGKAVLFLTGWSSYWDSEFYFDPNPFLTKDCCESLLDAGAVFAGIDSLNIDDTTGKDRPVHSALLRAGIPIVEHLTGLDALPNSGFRFFAVPVKVRGMGTFPVRAFAVLE